MQDSGQEGEGGGVSGPHYNKGNQKKTVVGKVKR